MGIGYFTNPFPYFVIIHHLTLLFQESATVTELLKPSAVKYDTASPKSLKNNFLQYNKDVIHAWLNIHFFSEKQMI